MKIRNVYEYRLSTGEKLYYVKIFIQGKQIVKRGFKTKKDAQAYASLQFALSSRSKRNKVSKIKELSYSFIKYLYEKYKESSAYRYTNTFKHYIEPFFAPLKIENVSEFTLENFNRQVNNLKIKSKKDILFIARVYLIFLKKYGLDPALSEKTLFVYKSQFTEPRIYDYYTKEEFDKFLSVIDHPMFYFIFLLLFDYGLRIGELRGLKHDDFTHDKVYIRRCVTNKNGRHMQVVTSVKTASSNRDYPLLDAIEKAYEQYIDSLNYPISKDDFVFLSSKSREKNLVVGETTIKRAQIHYCEKANLRVIKLHEFRHSCATYLFNQGAEVELVSAWLGHSDSSITLRVYAHLIPSRKLKLVDYFQ